MSFHAADHEDMNVTNTADALVSTAQGAASVVVMAGALVASHSDINPGLQTIGLLIGIAATSLTVINLTLTLKERWTKSRQRRRH